MSKRYKKVIFVATVSLVGLFALGFSQSASFFDGKLHIVFCDVGQGDGIYIKTPEGSDILIDGGQDNSILPCLSHNMPFWDRTIELMILTHPHADHLNGLIYVLDRYRIVSFATERLSNDSEGFRTLMNKLEDRNVNVKFLYKSDRITTADSVILKIIGPSKEFLLKTSPGGTIGEKGEFASLVIKLSYENFDVLFTGDAQKDELLEGIELLSDIEVLESPHHGSKTGLSQELVATIGPIASVISVGKKNRYGHPHGTILSLLKNSKIVRTDNNGEITIIADRHRWDVKTQR